MISVHSVRDHLVRVLTMPVTGTLHLSQINPAISKLRLILKSGLNLFLFSPGRSLWMRAISGHCDTTAPALDLNLTATGSISSAWESGLVSDWIFRYY